MGFAEGNAFEDEVICEVGGHHFWREAGEHFLRMDGEGGDGFGDDVESEKEGVEGGEDGEFVSLEVFVVGGGKAFEGDENVGEGADGFTGFATGELEDVWIFLLRHEAGAGGEFIC